MDYAFFLAFQQLQQDVADLKVMLAALVDEDSDKAAAKALAANVAKSSAALKAATPTP